MSDVSNGGGAGPAGRPSGLNKLFEQLMAMLRAGGAAAGTITIAGIRAAMPALEFYSGMRVDSMEHAGPADAVGLTRGERLVLKAAGVKALRELIEFTSVAYPAYKGAPAFVAIRDGEPQAPHLVHLLSLAIAAQHYFEARDETPPPPKAPPPSGTIAFLAVAPGEFAAHSGPLTPIEIRRSAMRHRSYAPPETAMMMRGSDPAVVGPASVPGRSPMIARYPALASGAPAAAKASPCGCGGTGHGCCGGAHDCGCGTHRHFPPARYNEDGTCAPVWQVSCDTTWRIRECFKIAFCDLLRCMSEEICEDGRLVEDPDLGPSVEKFLCSFLACLPDAICPPPEPACCQIGPPHDCGCNFAVGE
jgi:hypothetical protein